jgi:C_GCAxxG_C_C family probable redox protein
MESMERVEKALANHKKGYNCAQSVVCAYCGVFGIDEETAFRMSEAYGFGMGDMDACGAVTAMAMVTGMKESDGNTSSPATKKVCYKKMKQLIEEFKKKNATINCREIKGVDTGQVLRSCDGCIEDAFMIIEESLMQEESND